MGADTSKMREAAKWFETEAHAAEEGADGPVLTPVDGAGFAAAIRDGAAELEALRKGQAGPSVEERLTRYRCAAMSKLVGEYTETTKRGGPEDRCAADVEAHAHAMLAAERPPSPPPDVRDDAPAYNLAHRHGQESGARRVLAALEEKMRLMPDRTDGMTAQETANWIAEMRKTKWADGEGEG